MAVVLTDMITYRRLVTVSGADEIWYEDLDMAAGTMTELVAADGDIDTSDQLNMFEAFQKVFVVNGANLKVIDFVNTKLTITALTTAPTRGSIVTQATSNATMVVDFVNTAKTEIYGYVTSGTFVITAGYTLSGGSLDPETRVPSAVTANPHWYDWTVYPGGTSGTMPTKGYLGCLYRGRLVLSGSPNYPHQWYMSKTANPWNWVYASTDPLGAVAGNNADAGEIGDIIRALIPYKDEYLLFGCASTLWVLTGDPAGGGTISEVDLTTGMFGANSWCFDGAGNLYFWGTGGIYKSPLGFRSVENLTEIHLPDLLSDEDVDATSHRITMGYDIKRHGIVICITKLSDGTNSNYWYDLRLKGFFPETYPNECGAYSQYYYSANDNDLADLLVGCKDGYIRKFDNDKDDNIGNTTQLIDSYAVWPVQHLSEDNDKEGKLTSLTVELAGGGAGVPFSDTDGVTYEIHVADDAETLIENIISGDVPHSTGTLTGSGRKARIRARVRGAWLGLKFLNSTKSQTWAINRVYGVITPAGRIK